MLKLQEFKNSSLTINSNKSDKQKTFSLIEKVLPQRHHPIAQKSKWNFDLTKSSIENCLFWGAIYVAIYIAAFVLFFGFFWQWDIMNLLLGGIFIFNEPTIRHTGMYYIGLPATGLGGLILPWIRDTGPSLQSAFGFRYIPLFLAGVGAIVLVIIIGCIVIDVLKMILRNPK